MAFFLPTVEISKVACPLPFTFPRCHYIVPHITLPKGSYWGLAPRTAKAIVALPPAADATTYSYYGMVCVSVYVPRPGMYLVRHVKMVTVTSPCPPGRVLWFQLSVAPSDQRSLATSGHLPPSADEKTNQCHKSTPRPVMPCPAVSPLSVPRRLPLPFFDRKPVLAGRRIHFPVRPRSACFGFWTCTDRHFPGM